MQKKLIARTAKLSSESKKSRRFKGTAITYEHIPKDLDERNHGSIYAVINIDADTDSAQEITEIIIDAFHGEFYQDPNLDPLTSFEAALAKINEELADATHQGKIGWLNHLNAILAVLSGSTFHLTQAGKAEAYLYRGEKSSHVSDDLSGDSVNPLRTFINIASGNLQEGDKIAIATPGVFFHISKDELKKYVLEFQPRVAISHIADLIEGTTTETRPNAVLILEAITPEAASNETLTEQPDEVWISEPTKPFETAMDTAKPVLKKTGTVLGGVWATVTELTSDKVLPFAKEVAAESKDKISAWKKRQERAKKFKEQVLIDTEESLSHHAPTLEPVAELDELEDEVEVKVEAKEAVATKKPNEIFIREEQKERVKWLKLEKVNFSAAGKLGSKFKKSTEKFTKNRGMILAGTAIALILLIGGGYVTWQKREAAETLRLANASLAEAQSKYDSGKAQITEGQRKSAVNTLNEAQKLAEELKKNKLVATDATSLSDKIRTAIDEAENIQRISTPVYADATSIAGTNTIGPFAIGSNLYLINKENGSIAAINVKNAEVSNVLDKPELDGQVAAATAVTARRILVIMTDKAIYEFDPTAVTLKKQDAAGEIEKATAMAAFSTNIYSLDAESGKIYKRVKVSGGYGKRSEYIADGSDVKGATSIAIDSNMYALGSDGKVAKYLSGKKQDFTIEEMPFDLQKSGVVFTTEDVEGLYLTDGGRNVVIKVDAKGKYVASYTSDNFANLNGIFVDDASKTGYVSASGKIYKLSF